ncbi:DUF4249 domain-containing protein [Reichenbachiella ulvae]|uniref:DUF4249 domain-containing protein n=1 Tax=Reichenbachiella ulvae TaxID=2980104 RepID=A0ABT3CXY4_9BACT|nr:DUF4249 domain-containing protein [Reichenbachiella ulvae]MCV9388441.1 DUF4249 domain-containing protein [Reichenbachiella ulvae]
MSVYIKYSLIILSAFLFSCDDLISVDVEEKDPLVVIDAFIDNTSNEQKITVARSQPYFDETRIIGIEDATVEVLYGSPANTVVFNHAGEGVYTIPAGFGSVGDSFELRVTVDGETYHSFSSMNPVPPVDSVTFRYDEFDLFGENEIFYVGAFWAKDLEGEGNTYWIKSYKNGEFQNKLDMINLAYDAGFSAGSEVDGLNFIVPIRENVNDYDGEDDEFVSPFEDGDSLYVEIHAINPEVFDFLTLAVSNTNLPSGFGALFASPLSNTYGNISPVDPNSEEVVLGCFSVSAVSAGGKRLNVDEVPKEE